MTYAFLKAKSGAWRAAGLVLVFALLLVFGWTVWDRPEKPWYGYVVGKDQKIHAVNLTTGELEWSSRFLHELGSSSEDYREIQEVTANWVKPWEEHEVLAINIELNREESILYIGSRGDDILTPLPLIAIKFDEQLDTVFRVNWLDWKKYELERDSTLNVVELHFSSFKKALYVQFRYPFEECCHVLDPVTGEMLGRENTFLDKRVEYSPDGRMYARFTPERYSNGSRLGLVHRSGGVSYKNIETGEPASSFSLESYPELDFYPPWGSSDDHFVYVRTRGTDHEGSRLFGLEVYDRGTRELIASNYDFGRPGQDHATRIPGTNRVALTVGDEVIVFDGLTAEIVHRIRVAEDLKLVRSRRHG